LKQSTQKGRERNYQKVILISMRFAWSIWKYSNAHDFFFFLPNQNINNSADQVVLGWTFHHQISPAFLKGSNG